MKARNALAGYLAAAAICGTLWTVGLATDSALLAPFVPGALDAGLWRSLIVADAIGYALLPALMAWLLLRRRAAAYRAALLHAGMLTYGAAIGWGLVYTTGEGLLGAALMTTALLAAAVVVWALGGPQGATGNDLSPRVAVPASPGRNLAKTWAQTAAMWTVFLFVLPAAIVAVADGLPSLGRRFSGDAQQAAGAIVFVAGGALGLWTGALFATRGRGTPLPLDTARALVISGPYAHIRNPMAIASLAQGLGVALWLGSPLVLAYVVLGGVIWRAVALPWEERDLATRFGAAYERYRAAVPLWWPRRRPYRPLGQPELARQSGVQPAGAASGTGD